MSPEIDLDLYKNYSIIVYSDTTVTDRFRWRGDSSISYTQGSFYSTNNGATWVAVGASLLFGVYGNSSIKSTLNSPDDGVFILDSPKTFNATSESQDVALSLVNATIYIWNKNNTLAYKETKSITGQLNESIFNVAIPSNGEYYWNLLSCISDFCQFAQNNNSFTFGIANVSESSMSSVYETQSSYFNVSFNVSSGTPTGILWYNGTSYTGTVSNIGTNQYSISSVVQVPTTIGTLQGIFWEINLGYFNYNTTSQSQTISLVNASLCGSPYTTPFVNFTFKDESDLSTINSFVDSATFEYWLGDGTVTKTSSYSSPTTNNPSYAFCFVPAHKSIITDLSFKYSNTSYPQRTYSLNDYTLSNSTLNQVLYLLKSTEGIYSTIQVTDSLGNTIKNVDIVIERQISGVWTTLEQGLTGDDGGFTAWVNPNYDHRITATKTGYTSAQVTIRPSQSTYTLVLSTSSSNGTYVSEVPGLQWVAYPHPGSLKNATYNFNVTVTSADAVLENCKFELLNATNSSQILASSTSLTNTTYCQPSFNYALGYGQIVFGRLSVDTDSTSGFVIVDADWKWVSIDLNVKNWRTIISFFSDLSTASDFGTGNEAEFSRFVFFFLLTTILIGVFTYFSGFELNNPGSSILLIWFAVLIGSLSGFLTIETGSGNIDAVWEQYGLLLIFSLFTVGFMIDTWRRNRT